MGCNQRWQDVDWTMQGFCVNSEWLSLKSCRHDQNRWLADNPAERWHRIIKLMDFCSNWIERALAEIFTAATQPLSHSGFTVTWVSTFLVTADITKGWVPRPVRREDLRCTAGDACIHRPRGRSSCFQWWFWWVLEFLQISGDESRMSWNWNIKGQSHTEGWPVFSLFKRCWEVDQVDQVDHCFIQSPPWPRGPKTRSQRKRWWWWCTPQRWGCCRNHGRVAPDAETLQGYTASRVQ